MTRTRNTLEDSIQPLLLERKFENVLELLKNPENDAAVNDNVWNLISAMCFTLKTNQLLENDSDVISCKKILLNLVDRGNPKEVIVALMEEADSFKDHEFFCLLLDPLQKTLQKMPGKRGKSLEWVLSTLNAHIKTLSLPNDLDLQGEEMLLLDTDPAVIDANYILRNYLGFLKPFIQEVSFSTLQKKEFYYADRITYQQEILHKKILQLFHHPFLYHDLHVEFPEKPKSTIRILCENYIQCLSEICRNVFNLFKYDVSSAVKIKTSSVDEDYDEDEDDTVPKLAFSNLTYLIFVENIALGFQPYIFSHKYIFMNYLKYISLLLEKEENLVLYKGLHLVKVLLNKLEEHELMYDFMELEDFSNFPKLLLHVGIFSKIEAHRTFAVKLFLLYASKCDWKGRYHLIMQIVSTIDHSGAEGLVINLYKDYLHQSLNGCASKGYFLGKNLHLFLKQVFVLNDGVETDILQNYDKIITSLNLLRYLLLRDKRNENKTGIWNLTSLISEKFLNPLAASLDLSKAHYKHFAKDVTNDCRKRPQTINSTVSVNNELLPNVPPNFEKDMYQKALITFDMFESILCRVNELILL